MIAAILDGVSGIAQGANNQWEGSCGKVQFQVVARNNGHPLDNTYVLSVLTSQGQKEMFRGEDGGWFHAACLHNKTGEPLLIFQSYCGGSGCIESKYGAVEPKTLKAVLLPSKKNISNAKQLEVLTGRPAPHLGNYKEAFCCEN